MTETYMQKKEFQLFNEFIKTFLINKKSFITDNCDYSFEGDDIDNCIKAIQNVNTMSELKGVFFEKNKEGKFIEKSSISDDQKKCYQLLWHCYYIMYIMYKTSKSFLGNVESFKAKEDIFLDDSNRVASTKQVYSSKPIRPFSVLLNIFKKIWEKQKSNDERDENTKDVESVKKLILGIYKADENPIDEDFKNEDRVKNILLYLCDPNNYLPIISQSHKNNIEKYLGFLLDDNHKPGIAVNESEKEIVKQIAERLNNIISHNSANGDGNNRHKDDDSYLYDSLIRCFWDSQLINTNSDKNENLDVETLLRFKKAVVLYGPPGTSKTYSARSLAKSLICKEFARALKTKKSDKNRFFNRFFNQFAKKDDNNIFGKHIHKLQLHANYTYDDFIAGKTINKDKVITQEGYLLKLIEQINNEKTGKDSFKKLCSNLPHVLILDEINRVDISRIFGELFTAMEPGYRKDGGLELPLLDSSGHRLKLNVPENLYFIGTMNLIDFSLEQVDFALRRRFAWVKNTFDKERLQAIIIDKLKNDNNVKDIIDKNIDDYVSSCEALNIEIKNETTLGEKFWIGHTFFAEIVDIIKETQIQDIKKAKEFLWSISLKPMLEAYCGTMDDMGQKSFITRCKTAFMPQDNTKKNNNNIE